MKKIGNVLRILKDKNSNIEIVGVKLNSAADRKFEQKGKMAEW